MEPTKHAPFMLLADLTWPDIAALSKDTPIIFPVAALEQHGRHMPVFTDSMLMGEISRRAEIELKDEVLFAPLQWLGNSHHHMEFPGTMSAEPRVYLDLLCGMLENFISHGFKRLIILNGHGGNDVPGKQAVFEMRQKHRTRSDLLLLFATYWNLVPDPASAHPDLKQQVMGHACEWETSMMLRFTPASRGWITKDRSAPGHIGWPHLASAEKGEHLFNAFAADVVSLLERVARWDGNSWNG